MSTITIPARALRKMLAAVLPHAGEDDLLPALNAVRFEAQGGVLYLIATDRYSIGIARQPIPGATIAPVPNQDALLSRADAQNLYERLEGRDGTAAIIIAGDKITVDYGGPVDSWGTIAPNGVTWPDWRKLLHALLAAEPASLDGGFGVDMRLLARFAIDPGPYWLWEDDPPEPEWPPEAARIRIVRPEAPAVLATRGDWFFGAAMPVILDRYENVFVPPPWDDWTAICAPDSGVEAA